VSAEASLRSPYLRKLRKGLRLLLNRKYRHGLYRGAAAAIEHLGALGALDVGTVVDVGANVGQFSLLAWQLFPQAKIHAFEPQQGPAEVFLRLFPPSSPAKLYRAAIGKHSGEIEMHISRRHDSSSLLPITRAMTTVFPGTEEIGRERVSVAPLASFLSAEEIVAPALLKIDVQGTELDVLHGCSELLDRFRYVYVELSFVVLYVGQALCNEVIAYLAGRGFRLRGVHNLREDRQGQAIQADFLFVRDAAPAPS
jgi:FkbM family methyltransferase